VRSEQIFDISFEGTPSTGVKVEPLNKKTEHLPYGFEDVLTHGRLPPTHVMRMRLHRLRHG